MTVRIAVAGAGLIGARHLAEVQACPDTEVACIVDPSPAADGAAGEYAVPRYDTLAELFAGDRPDGVILATPNTLHAAGGLECVAAGVPVLVEKPVAHTVADGTRLVEAAEEAGVPLLVGHHRQHSPIMAAAREVVHSGRLGRLVAVVGTALFYKPDDYFDVGDGWRRKSGGGPLLINLIHEVNNLMQLAGPIAEVQATASSATRGFPVEDTAGIVLRFAGGALGTFLLSDAAASPRSWEQTSRENPDYATYPGEDAYHLAGTAGSLSVPTLRLHTSSGPGSWYRPMAETILPVDRVDPLGRQVAHFAAVIRGEQEPLISGRDGLNALRVTEAVLDAARTGRTVSTGLGPSPASADPTAR